MRQVLLLQFKGAGSLGVWGPFKLIPQQFKSLVLSHSLLGRDLIFYKQLVVDMQLSTPRSPQPGGREKSSTWRQREVLNPGGREKSSFLEAEKPSKSKVEAEYQIFNIKAEMEVYMERMEKSLAHISYCALVRRVGQEVPGAPET